MNNIIAGLSTSNLIQDTTTLYNSRKNESESTENDFLSAISQQRSFLINSRVNNVPIGRMSYTSIDIPNYNNSNNDNLNINENSSTSEIIESIQDTTATFRVTIDAKDESTKTRISNAVKAASDKYGVDPNLILAVIQKESYFNPNATSKSGAQGLMQIMPSNFKYLGVTNGYNIENNIDCGTKLLKEYMDKYNGNIEMALMAYNGGPTNMSRRGVKSINDLYKMRKETQKYVPTVMKIYRGEI